MADNSDINSLRKILKTNKNIAVVGLSAKWHRPSYFAAKYMKEHGYNIVPVNPAYDEILGEKCFPTLLDIDKKIDIVNCFRKSEDIGPLVPMAIDIGAKVFWMQLGIYNEEAEKKINDAGLECVQDRCVKIEHARLFGGLNWVGVNTKVISAKRPNWQSIDDG